MRVRADEIRVGDTYICKAYGGRGLAEGIVSAVKVEKVTRPANYSKTPGRMVTQTRVTIISRELMPITVAPHSMHTVRRPRGA